MTATDPRERQAEAQREKQKDQLERHFREADRLAGGTAEQPMNPSIRPERTRQFRSTNLSRMRTEWSAEDRQLLTVIAAGADRIIAGAFADAFWLMDRIYSKVRQPVADPETGEVQKDVSGRIRWQRGPEGFIIEDWSRFTSRDRSNLLDELVTHLFEWEQQAATMWGSAMFAKGAWEEAFADAYVAGNGRLTIDDRTQRGHQASIERRYFGIFQAMLSRRADAIIRSMERLEELMMRSTR